MPAKAGVQSTDCSVAVVNATAICLRGCLESVIARSPFYYAQDGLRRRSNLAESENQGRECFAVLLRNKMLALCQPLVAARHAGRAERDLASR